MSDDDVDNNITQVEKPKRKVGRPKGVKDSVPRERSSSKVAKKSRRYVPFTSTKRNRFLRLLEKTGNVNSAAAEVGISRATVYALEKRNPVFAERVQLAKDKALGMLEKEAVRRAHDGVERGKYYKGEKIGTEKEYSDTLLMKLMEASDPERYGKRSNVSIDHQISVNGDSAKQKLAALLKVELNGDDDTEVIDGDFEEVDDED